MLYFP